MESLVSKKKAHDFKNPIVVRDKFPDRIPVVIKLDPDISQSRPRLKYLLYPGCTLGIFLIKIRNTLTNIDKSDALFMIIENKMMSLNTQIHELDNNKPDFVYIHVSKERTFG